eukprot:PLAT6119.1.p1 GENE.PLAT6119.1~~PLAT6119.1.p1  ORF type:complete len:2075 (-),score=991.99 PLAT6119.1:205-6429(-)
MPAVAAGEGEPGAYAPHGKLAWFLEHAWSGSSPEEKDAPLQGHSLCIFPPDSAVRLKLRAIVYSPWVEMTIFLIILGNMVTLALTDPAAATPEPALKLLDDIFLAVFAAEVAMKIVAIGLTRYLTVSAWNVLDFVVVVTGYIDTLLVLNFNINALRALRVLKPLRAMRFFSSIDVILTSLRRSTRFLLDIFVVLAFFFTLFGVVSISNLGGSLRRRCALMDGVITGRSCSNCTLLEPPLHCNFDDQLKGGIACADWGPYTCIDTGVNPSNGLVGFDNLIMATYTNFQITSMEGWTDIMYAVQDAEFPLAWPYFVLVVVSCAYLVMNMSVSVICSVFSEVWDDEQVGDAGELATVAQSVVTAKHTLRKRATNAAKGLTGFLKRRLSRHMSASPSSSAVEVASPVVLPVDRSGEEEGDDGGSRDGHARRRGSAASSIGSRHDDGHDGHSHDDDDAHSDADLSVVSDDGHHHDAAFNEDSFHTLIHMGGERTPRRRPSTFRKVALRGLLAHRLQRPHTAAVSADGPPGLPPRRPAGAGGGAPSTAAMALWSLAMRSSVRERRSSSGAALAPRTPTARVSPAPPALSAFARRPMTSASPGMRLASTLALSPAPPPSIPGRTAALPPPLELGDDRLLRRPSTGPLTERSATSIVSGPPVRGDLTDRTGGSDEMGISSLVTETLSVPPASPGGALAAREGSARMDTLREIDAFETLSELGELVSEAERAVDDMENPPSPTRVMARRLVSSTSFQNFIALAILVNTALMVAEDPNAAPAQRAVFLWLEVGFTILFGLEILISIYAFKLGAYLRQGMNQFDVFIVVSSIVTLVLGEVSDSSSLSSLGAFRVLRMVRVFRFSRFFLKAKRLRKLLQSALSSVEAWAMVGLLQLFSMVCMAIVCMQLWGGAFPSGERVTFDTFPESMLTLFIISTGEDWNAIYYNCQAASRNRWACAPVLLGFFIYSSYILLNLFTAIIISNFETSEDDKELFQELRYEELKALEGVDADVDEVVMFGARTATFRKLPIGKTAAGESAAMRGRRFSWSSLPSVEDDDGGPSLPGRGSSGALLSARSGASAPAADDKHAGGAHAGHHGHSAAPDSPAGRLGLPARHAADSSGVVEEKAAVHSTGSIDIGRHAASRSAGDLRMSASGAARPKSYASPSPVPSVVSAADSLPAPDSSASVSPSDAAGDRAAAAAAATDGASVSPAATLPLADVSVDFGKSEKISRRSTLLAFVGQKVEELPFYSRNRALFVLEPEHWLRRACAKLLETDSTRSWLAVVFDWGILLAIVVSSIFLAAESGDNRNSPVFRVADVTFACIFLLEFVVKVIAQGFVFGPDAYLRHKFNWLDFFVLIVALANLGASATASAATLPPWTRALRLGRCLRVVRMVNRMESMRVLVESILEGLPIIANTVMLVLAFFFVFAIVGKDLFGGRFGSCTDSSVPDRAACVGTVVVAGMNVTREWVVPATNFDSIGASFLALFEISTLEGWVTIMHNAMDMTDIDTQPSLNATPASAFFFVLFIFVCTFIMLELLVGVAVENLNVTSGNDMMTAVQKEAAYVRKMVSRLKPLTFNVPRSGLRRWCYDICVTCDTPSGRCGRRLHAVHFYFEMAMVAVVMMNTVVLMTLHDPISAEWSHGIAIANLVFLVIFVVEMVVKLLALGRSYFDDPMNTFDCIIVMGSLLLETLDVPGGTQIARVFRIGRLLRLVNSAKDLRILVNTLYTSLGDILNVTLLYLLLFFMYAVIGSELFGEIDATTSPVPLVAIDRHNNFRTFDSTIMLLFRMSTGENWQQIMHDCQTVLPAAPIYFVSFVLLGAYILLNFFFGLILENFEYSFRMERSRMSYEDVRLFQKLWFQFDAASTGTIRKKDLFPLLREVATPAKAPRPRGAAATSRKIVLRPAVQVKPLTRTKFMRYLTRMLRSKVWRKMLELELVSIRDDPLCYRFQDVLSALVRMRFGVRALTPEQRLEREQKFQRWREHMLVARIQSHARGFLARRRARGMFSEEQHALLNRVRSTLHMMDLKPKSLMKLSRRFRDKSRLVKHVVTMSPKRKARPPVLAPVGESSEASEACGEEGSE